MKYIRIKSTLFLVFLVLACAVGIQQRADALLAAPAVSSNMGFGMPPYMVTYSANPPNVTVQLTGHEDPDDDYSTVPILDADKNVIGFIIKDADDKEVKRVYVPGMRP